MIHVFKNMERWFVGGTCLGNPPPKFQNEGEKKKKESGRGGGKEGNCGGLLGGPMFFENMNRGVRKKRTLKNKKSPRILKGARGTVGKRGGGKRGVWLCREGGFTGDKGGGGYWGGFAVAEAAYLRAS